ncbi:MAG: hypothetical protein PHV34_20705 [Verrucomicrobiae bacterium]|nr:hypothetical protein [Verrucomicrobiae bacterium]
MKAASGHRRVAVCLFAGVVCAAWWSANRVAGVELPYRNEETRQLLLQSAKDEDRAQRVRAGTALAGLGDERNKEAIEKLASDPVEAVREAVKSNIQAGTNGEARIVQPCPAGFVPRPAIDPSTASENHRDPRVRLQARLLKLKNDPSCKDDFSRLLDDADYCVRREVSKEVVKSRGADSLSVWRKLLGSGKLDEQVEAAWAVGQLGSKADEGAMAGFLNSSSTRLQLIVADGLWRMGGDAARQALGEAIVKANGPIQERYLELAGHLKASAALPAIRQLVADKKTPEKPVLAGLDALASMADAESKPILLKIVTDYRVEFSNRRKLAAKALGKIGAKEAVAPLYKLVTQMVIPVPMAGLCYEEDKTRAVCVEALGELGAGEELKKMLNEAFLVQASEPLLQALAESLSKSTGIPHDYRRTVTARTYFVDSMKPMTFPPELAENQKQQPVFQIKPK